MNVQEPERGTGSRRLLTAALRTAAAWGAVWLTNEVRRRLAAGDPDTGPRADSWEDAALVGIARGLDRTGETAHRGLEDAGAISQQAHNLVREVIRTRPSAPSDESVELAAELAVVLLRAGISELTVRKILDYLVGDPLLPPKRYADEPDESDAEKDDADDEDAEQAESGDPKEGPELDDEEPAAAKRED